MNQNEETQKISRILKYDTHRYYFKGWTPAQIHDANCEARKNPERDNGINIHTGAISVDNICGALWNEMSYNPERFGYKSPFIFNGKNDIYAFCKMKTEDEVLLKIKNYLDTVLEIAKKLDSDFKQTNRVNVQKLTIAVNIDNGSISRDYVFLTCLCKAIRVIASQNLKDFRIKKYSSQIIKRAKAKHPNLLRSDNTHWQYQTPVQIDLQMQNDEPNTSTQQIQHITKDKTQISHISYTLENLQYRLSAIDMQINVLRNDICRLELDIVQEIIANTRGYAEELQRKDNKLQELYIQQLSLQNKITQILNQR